MVTFRCWLSNKCIFPENFKFAVKEEFCKLAYCLEIADENENLLGILNIAIF